LNVRIYTLYPVMNSTAKRKLCVVVPLSAEGISELFRTEKPSKSKIRGVKFWSTPSATLGTLRYTP